MVLGLLFLGAWSKDYFESRDFQSVESDRLDGALRAVRSSSLSEVARPGAFIGVPDSGAPQPPPPREGVLGKIEIPRLHIMAIIADGADTRTLRHAVGHIPFTAPPGSPGNCALAGHRDTFLRGLGGVRVHDLIRIVTLQHTYDYQVEWSTVVEPQRVDVLDSTATPSLTLITCYPFAFVGHAPRRFVVRATQMQALTDPATIDHRGAFLSRNLTAERR